MRQLSPELAAHCAGETTTLCRAWKLTRRDGVALGFTDHDRDLAFEGVTFSAGAALEAAEATASLGFAVGGGDVAGALVAAGITAVDLDAGRYDDARVENWLVDWADPDNRVLLDVHVIGEVRRADGAFVAELRSLAHRLDEERGLLYRASCSADLGDSRCGVSLTARAAEVTQTHGAAALTAASLADLPDGWLEAGRIDFVSGENAGLTGTIRAHRAGGRLDLWSAPAFPIAAGDRIEVWPGCDKSFATCRAKFANSINFRGFPHMPGNDFIVAGPRDGGPDLDGGSLFR